MNSDMRFSYDLMTCAWLVKPCDKYLNDIKCKHNLVANKPSVATCRTEVTRGLLAWGSSKTCSNITKTYADIKLMIVKSAKKEQHTRRQWRHLRAPRPRCARRPPGSAALWRTPECRGRWPTTGGSAGEWWHSSRRRLGERGNVSAKFWRFHYFMAIS